HSVYSIGLPIFLFGLVFPELKTKRLVSGTPLAATALCLIADSIFLFVFVSAIYSGYNPGGTLLLFSGLVAATFVVLARKLPDNFLRTNPGQPKWSPRKFAFAGALLFPATLLAEESQREQIFPQKSPCVRHHTCCVHLDESLQVDGNSEQSRREGSA